MSAKRLNDGRSRNPLEHPIFERIHSRGAYESGKPPGFRDPRARRLRLSETLVCERATEGQQRFPTLKVRPPLLALGESPRKSIK
jgi:hypothetical protein